MIKERVFAEGQLVLRVADYVRRGMAGPSKFAKMGGTPSDKRGASKWVLLSGLDGWQGPAGSHQ